MKPLQFDFTWRDAPGCHDSAIRYSMADLGIRVGDESITKVYDRKSRSVRDTVFVSLYPIAEWIVANWWPLLEENRSSGRDGRSYEERHCLAYAADGFALPRLMLIPEEHVVLLQWADRSSKHQAVEFIGGGESLASKSQVSEVLSEFLDAVFGRLSDCHVEDTWAQQEWRALRETPLEEADFCRAAGHLGLDPFNMPPETVESVLQVASSMPPGLAEEVFRSVAVESLGLASEWIHRGIDKMAQAILPPGNLERFRSTAGRHPANAAWEQGYLLAKELHGALGLPEQLPVDLRAILGQEFPLIRAEASFRSIDGLVGGSTGTAFRCYTAKWRRPESERFILARAFGMYLEGGADDLSLLSAAVTEKQQRNRAFAAELLAPAKWISQHLPSDLLSAEDVEDLAREFQVSTYVISHQIVNHKLAALCPEA